MKNWLVLATLPFWFSPRAMAHDEAKVRTSAGLSPPPASEITTREACQLSSMLLAFLQSRNQEARVCNPVEIAKACTDVMALSRSSLNLLTPEESAEMHRRVPNILNRVYECLNKISDPGLISEFQKKERLLKRKADLMKAGCAMMGALSLSGQDPKGEAQPEVPGVDFENPCLSMLKVSRSRVASCFKTGEGICKTVTGQIELENLIPPGIWEASVAKKLPIDLPAYLEGAVDGAMDVLKDRTADRLNEVVSRKVLSKGTSGVIALAAITAAAKQINMTVAHGNNDWANCLGTAQAGACLHTLFAGGPPQSAPLARAKVVGGKSQIDCCHCTLGFYRADGILRDTFLRYEDYLSPIEEANFKSTLCSDQIGTRRDINLTKSEGHRVYFKFDSCRKVTIAGESCLLSRQPRTREPVRVLREMALDRPTKGVSMVAPKKAKFLYPPGARRDDGISEESPFAKFFELPRELAEKSYAWQARRDPEPQLAARLPESGSTRKAALAEKLSKPRQGKMAESAPELRKSFAGLKDDAPATVAAGLHRMPPRTHSIIAAEAPEKAPVCACSKEWSVWQNSRRWEICVVRKDGAPLSHDYNFADDESCTRGCAKLMATDAVRGACTSVSSSAAPVVSAPACNCSEEWSEPVNHTRTKLCVLRKGSQAVHWSTAYLEDAGCVQVCQQLRSSPQGEACRQ